MRVTTDLNGPCLRAPCYTHPPSTLPPALGIPRYPWFGSTSTFHNSIAGPQDLWRCCPSEVGYEPDRSVIHSFILLFLPFYSYVISMLLRLRGCAGNTSSEHVFTVVCAEFVNLRVILSPPWDAPQAQFPTGYEPRWLSRSAEVLRKPAGLSWHPGQVTGQLWKVLRLRQENCDKSCDWHMHLGELQ